MSDRELLGINPLSVRRAKEKGMQKQVNATNSSWIATQKPQKENPMPKTERLRCTSYITIIVAFCIWVLSGIYNQGKSYMSRVRDGNDDSLVVLALGNAMQSTWTVTNLNPYPQRYCSRGEMSQGILFAYTKTVCTGRMEPFSTVTMESPFSPGEVKKVCKHPTLDLVDMDRCTFNTIEPPRFTVAKTVTNGETK